MQRVTRTALSSSTGRARHRGGGDGPGVVASLDTYAVVFAGGVVTKRRREGLVLRTRSRSTSQKLRE